MGTTRVRVDPDDPSTLPVGRIDAARVDAAAEAEIAAQEREDEEEAMRDMARYARRVRRRLGLSQTGLARRIDVSHETIRNREQGKRCPTGGMKTGMTPPSRHLHPDRSPRGIRLERCGGGAQARRAPGGALRGRFAARRPAQPPSPPWRPRRARPSWHAPGIGGPVAPRPPARAVYGCRLAPKAPM